MDEEVPIDSDEESSVHTSEDDFVKDDAKVRDSMKREDLPINKDKDAHILT